MLKSIKTKNAIIKSAINLFKEKGYYRTSVDEIVKKAGIAKGTYYYYFKQKEDVLLTIIRNDFDSYFDLPERIAFSNELNAIEKFEKILNALFVSLNSSSGIESYFDGGLPIQFQASIDEIRLKKLLPLISRIIEQGNLEGKFEVLNVDIVSSIINRGITSHIHSEFENFDDMDYFKSTLVGIEEVINNSLKSSEKIRVIL